MDTAISHAQNPNVLRLARDLYATYNASCEGKNYQGLPCPAWDALPESVRGHWYTVALRVCSMANRANALADRTHGDEAALTMACSKEPGDFVCGHLPNPAAARSTWRTYAGIEVLEGRTFVEAR